MVRLFMILLVLSLAPCGQAMANETTPPSDSYEQAHASAVAAMKIAADRGHAWNTADALLEQAEAAAAEGDENTAIRLADDARIQAELAVRQADSEEAAWKDRVLSD